MDAKRFQELLAQLEQGKEAVLRLDAEGRTVTRRFVPQERLILLGGGHVALALAKTAAALDFAVTVADDRAAFANRERFPEADRVVCDGFEHAIAALSVRETDYVCILTRGHRWDNECLRALLRGTEPFYLGMIGSRRRVAGLLGMLKEQGFDAGRLSRIHSPIGLSIGAVTPSEIAISIAAQLIERRRSVPREDAGETAQVNTDLTMLRFLAEGEGERVLCLVLETRGSTPVKSGAMMAVDARGRGYGTVGGGCGEAMVMAKAQHVLKSGEDTVVEIDLTDDAAAEDGLTCGGTMRVWISRLT